VKDLLSLASDIPASLLPLWVAAVAMVDEAGRVLMQQRLPGGAHGGLWEFPGGKLEPGESPEHAAARELAEELGVAIAPADLLPVGFASGSTEGSSPTRPLVILLFACRRWARSPMPRAAAQLAWCDLGQLPDLAMPPLDYPLAEALRRMLA
jgi:8-oxo-dGTP diphosphatase